MQRRLSTSSELLTSSKVLIAEYVIWPVLAWHLRMLNAMMPAGRHPFSPGKAAMLSVTHQSSLHDGMVEVTDLCTQSTCQPLTCQAGCSRHASVPLTYKSTAWGFLSRNLSEHLLLARIRALVDMEDSLNESTETHNLPAHYPKGNSSQGPAAASSLCHKQRYSWA